MASADNTTNKGNGKGPILGPGNKPISESDRVKYKAVDAAQTKSLKASNAVTAKKQAAIKEAVAGKGAKKAAPAAKKAAPKTVAKAPVKKAAPKKAK